MKSVWDSIDEMSDSLISYNLFKEGKTIYQISKIRNMDEHTIKFQLFEIKKQLSYEVQNTITNEEDFNISDYLSMTKVQRLECIERIRNSGNEDKMERMIEEALITTSNIEDIMVLIWTIGEFNFINFKNKLKYFCSHPHGNIRRMAFSAMGKMGLEEFLPYLINGLKDKKPQVKQYAIIAFGKISKEDNIERLYSIINDINEKEYIKRAAEQSIEQILGKVRAGDNNEGT